MCSPVRALGVLAAGAPTLARAAGPQEQLTWAIHVSLAPTWFDPAETLGLITPFMVLYALHDAMVKPMPDNAHAPVPRQVVDDLRGRPQLRFRAAQGRQIPQRRAGDRRGREILVRALPRRRSRVDEGSGGRDRDARSSACPLHAEAAVARFLDLLLERHRRRLDRAEEICREGRRRRLQEGADRRRPLQVRLVHAGRRAGAGSLRRLLAQDPERQAAGDEGDPRRVDAAGRAEARRGRHRLFDPRRARRGIAEDARA